MQYRLPCVGNPLATCCGNARVRIEDPQNRSRRQDVVSFNLCVVYVLCVRANVEQRYHLQHKTLPCPNAKRTALPRQSLYVSMCVNPLSTCARLEQNSWSFGIGLLSSKVPFVCVCTYYARRIFISHLGEATAAMSASVECWRKSAYVAEAERRKRAFRFMCALLSV